MIWQFRIRFILSLQICIFRQINSFFIRVILIIVKLFINIIVHLILILFFIMHVFIIVFTFILVTSIGIVQVTCRWWLHLFLLNAGLVIMLIGVHFFNLDNLFILRFNLIIWLIRHSMIVINRIILFRNIGWSNFSFLLFLIWLIYIILNLIIVLIDNLLLNLFLMIVKTILITLLDTMMLKWSTFILLITKFSKFFRKIFLWLLISEILQLLLRNRTHLLVIHNCRINRSFENLVLFPRILVS